MKQILVLASALTILGTAPVFADDCGCNKDLCMDGTSICKKIDKDNECYFDKQYIKLKKEIGLDCAQEKRIDCYYSDFKDKMTTLKNQMNREQKRLCSMIEKEECNKTIREKRKSIREIGKEMKNECKIFDKSVKSELCGDQKGRYRTFKRHEKSKMKKLFKNCRVFRLPCVEGCSTAPKCNECNKTYNDMNKCNKKPGCGECNKTYTPKKGCGCK